MAMSPLHIGNPLSRLARNLQRLAAQKRPHLPMLHAVLSEELQIQPLLVGVKLLARLVCHIAVYLLC